jgi:DNA-binding transcriptional MerR regulator
MLRMPVATLRVWERRYAVCAPQLTDSGQRLYSAADVQRLALIQQLVAHGHAIGTLAPLSAEALHAVASTHAGTTARTLAPAEAAPLRVHTADAALRERLAPLATRPDGTPGVTWVGADEPADVHLTRHARLLPETRLSPPPPGTRWGVLLRYAAAPAVARLQAAGAEVLREPADAAALAAWWTRLSAALPRADVAMAREPAAAPPPPRWDEATLQAFAGLSTTIACECPRHLAELLIQLGQFEAYSADCASRGPEDAALHRHLQQVSGQARVLLEDALARVAEAEGLISPRSGA